MKRTFSIAAAGLALVLGAGCATNALQQARTADELHEYDVAVAQYLKAVRLHPEDRDAQLGLATARLRAADAHFTKGRRLYAIGRYEEAAIELQLASELNPSSGDIDRDLRSVRNAIRTKLAAPQEGQTQLESLLARTRDLPASGYEVPDAKLSQSFQTGPNATSRQVFLTIAKMADLSVIFDPTFRDAPAPVSLLSDNTVRQALDAVAQSTGNFYKVTAPRTITVVPNNAAKQREYIEEVSQTFFLQYADLKETQDTLRAVGDIRAVAPSTAIRAVQIRDTPDRVAAAGRLIRAIDKAPAEMTIDVEILEVNRTRLREYGLQLASPGSPGLDGSIQLTNEAPTLDSLRHLAASDLSFGGMPALFYRLLQTDTNTRTLANPHARMTDGVPAKLSFGDDVPIRVQKIESVTNNGLPTQPITTFSYRTIGVNINLTSRAHANDDVTLVLDISLTTFKGLFDGNPQFGSRTVQTTLTLKDGETNILAGLIRSDERMVRDGIPGLGKIRFINHLFTKNQREAEETDVVIMLTPHIVRVLNLTEEDLRPFKIQRAGISGGPIEGDIIAPPPSPIGRGGGPGGAPVESPAFPPLDPPQASTPPAPRLPVTPGVPPGTPVPIKIIKH